MDRRSLETSKALFNNQLMAGVGAWVSEQDTGVPFGVSEMLDVMPLATVSMITPVISRFVEVGMITYVTEGTRTYSRNDHELWEPFGALCKLVVRPQVERR
jgi:hypothetical protein